MREPTTLKDYYRKSDITHVANTVCEIAAGIIKPQALSSNCVGASQPTSSNLAVSVRRAALVRSATAATRPESAGQSFLAAAYFRPAAVCKFFVHK